MYQYNNMDEVAVVFKKLFATEDGKAVLYVLSQRFKEPALTPPAAVDGMALALMTQQRLGEHNVIKYIESLMNRELGKNDRYDNND
jgi:hypothetical protein